MIGCFGFHLRGNSIDVCGIREIEDRSRSTQDSQCLQLLRREILSERYSDINFILIICILLVNLIE